MSRARVLVPKIRTQRQGPGGLSMEARAQYLKLGPEDEGSRVNRQMIVGFTD